MIALCASVAFGSSKNLPLAQRFSVGDQTTYQLDYKNESRADMTVLFQNSRAQGRTPEVSGNLKTTVSITLKGSWTTAVVDATDKDILLASHMLQPQVRFRFNGQEAVADAQVMQADLQRECFIWIDRQGRISSLQFDPSTSEVSKGLIRAIVSLTQFVVPDRGGTLPTRWDSLEGSPSGQVQVQYQRQSSGEPHMGDVTVKKIVTHFIVPKRRPRPDEIPVRQTITPTGSVVFVLDIAKGRIASVSGTLTEHTAIGGKNVAQAETVIAFSRVKTISGETTAMAQLRDTYTRWIETGTPAPLVVRPSEEESETAIQRNELKDATVESLLRDLADAEASPDRADETSLFLKFKALVYLHPKTSAQLGDLIKTAPAAGMSMRLLVGALSDAGHREAEQALIAAIKARPDDAAALIPLISALANLALPSREAETLVRAVAQRTPPSELTMTAELMLGQMARTLAEEEPKRANAIVDEFIGALRLAASDERKEQLLLVLGNAGLSRALPVLKSYLGQRTPSLRGAAAFSLRFIEAAQADTLLAQTLGTDPAGPVRAEAARALGFRDATKETFQAQKKALLSDKSMAARLAVVRNLWTAREMFPEAKELIRSAASKDPAADVRKAAAEIMSQNPEEFPNKQLTPLQTTWMRIEDEVVLN